MKTLRTIACVLSSLVILTALASCSSGSSSDAADASDHTRIACYCGYDPTDDSANPIMCDLYDDGSWVATVCQNNSSFTPLYVTAKGTYTGDPSKDGIVALTFTQYADKTYTLKDSTSAEPKKPTITSGTVVYDGYRYTRQLLPNS